MPKKKKVLILKYKERVKEERNKMDYSLIRNLAFSISFLVLIAHISSRITILKKQLLNHQRDLKGTALLIVFFTFISILSTYIGIGVNGAIVNTRSICVLSAGLIGGPVVGMTSAVFTGLHRWLFDIGGFTSLSCACATVFVEGGLGCLFHRAFIEGRLKRTKLILLAFVSEIGQIVLILLLSRPLADVIALLDIIALPMILTNSFGIIVFIGAFQYIFLEQESIADRKVSQAITIARSCLPYFRNGLSNQKDMDKITESICQNSPCVGAAIIDENRIYSCYGKLHLKEELPFMRQAMQERRCTAVHTEKECPQLAEVLLEHIVIAAPLLKEESNIVVGCLILLEPKRWIDVNKEYLFAESLAAFFSSQLELSQIAYQKELLRKAECKRLQSQVDPHFLFNSLNTISYFCRSKPDHAKELLLLLAKYYRFSIRQEDTLIPLSKELEHIDIYLQLEKARFEEKLIYEQRISSDFQENIQIPSLLLQPIVENAIRHGVSADGTRFVCVSIEQTMERLTIKIEDHGSGFPEEVLKGLEEDVMDAEHIGLLNVHRRLKCIYGANHGLSVLSTASGSVVTIEIPLCKENEI